MIKKAVLSSSLAALAIGTASAAIVLPVGIEGHHQGDSTSGDGSVVRAIDLSGITQVNPTDPGTWTHSNAWQDDWQGFNANFADPNANFAVIDLGGPTADLETMYLWNVNEGNHTARGVQDFEIFYAVTPSVLPGATSGTNQTYDFTSGGWTQLGGTFTLTQGTGVAGLTPDSFDVTAAGGAQYIGLRLNSYYANDSNRVGFSEVVFTTIPEPGSVALLLVGLAGLVRRRR